MNNGHDSKVERIINIFVQESSSQMGSIRINIPAANLDHTVLVGLAKENYDLELFEQLRSEPLFKEVISKKSTYVFEVKDNQATKHLYDRGVRYGLLIPLYYQDVMMGLVFLGRYFAYTREVVENIEKKVSTFAEYYAENFLSHQPKMENKIWEPLPIRLKRYEQSAKALFEHNPDIMWWMDTNGTIISANSRIEEICGFQKKLFIGESFDQFVANKDLDIAIGCFVMAKKGKPQNFEASFIHREGHHVELNITFVPVTVDYQIVGVYGISKDITEKKKYEAALKESNELITDILESITDGFLAVDNDWRITYWNRETEIFTDKKREEVLGEVLWNVLPYMVETPMFTKLHKVLHEGITEQYEFYNEPTDRWYWVHAYPSKTGISIYINDITGRKKAEQQVAYMTYYDTLTNLPNQTLFRERLNSSLLRAKSTKETFAVMMMALDRFKMINDLMGYGKGDRVLISVSKRLASSLREEDTIYRYEGDIFTVILRKVDQIQLHHIAERVIKEFQKPFEFDHREMVITPSIGISFYPDDGGDCDQLLANADTAMRHAKENGKNNYQIYNDDMKYRTSLNIIHDLQKALNRNELMIAYQPQVNIRTGKITGAEALLRWSHPEYGIIAPGEFISIAEETGLIVPIGEWVLKTVCAQNKAWQDAGYGPFVVSVNLSARQFSAKNMVEVVRSVLEESGLDPKYLDLEITESMTMDVTSTIDTLNELKKLGVHISMDDFGKGYSSLTYLKLFPLDTLKIDQSFVRDCATDSSDATIVRTIISMAHHLNLNVIAEGVETKEQFIYLQRHLCNEAQGFLFSKPITAVEFIENYREIQDSVKDLGLDTDLTERMWMEEQLRIARQDLQDTMRRQQGMIFKVKEQEGRFIHTLCDGELLYRFGMLPEDVVGKELADFLPQDVANELSTAYERAWQGESDVTYEGRFNDIYFFTSLRPVYRGRKIVEVIGSCTDMTKRKLAEEALQKADAQYRIIAENMSDLIMIIDPEGIIQYASPSHQAVLGYSTEEYIGKSGFGIHPDDMDFVFEKFGEMIRTKTPDQIEFRFQHREGRWVNVEARGTPVYKEDGELEYIILVTRDITERKKTEDYFLKSEKLAVVGELAAGIAHEIRNPVASIKGFVQLMKSVRVKQEYFDIMLAEIDNLEAKINEFLMLAKPQAAKYVSIDLWGLLQEVLILTESQAILRNIELVTEPLRERTAIWGDRQQIKQVLVNIIKNAIESMLDGGEILIQIGRVDSDNVMITFIDQGCGIDEERLKKIGEPFYSNKEKGTGLGLTISRRIVKEHHGSIEFRSELNKGTRVDLIFPILKQ